jgi:sporulation protein YlmC with PRC-barrel domain
MDGLPIISLQTSEAVALARSPIIDIATLEIQAFHCRGAQGHQPLLLMTRDIRQMATDCIIIDSADELADPSDIIRLQQLIEDAYSPIGKMVISDAGRKLGTVDDYSINLDTNRVQKLYVRGGILSSWLGTNLAIDRTQIIDITPQKITVREATIKSPLLPSEPIPESPS